MELIPTVALLHLMACLSPGPDILLVMQTSLRDGFRLAMATTIGILTGVALHITFGLTGVSYLIAGSDPARAGLSLAGASYLVFLGGRGLSTAKSPPIPSASSPDAPPAGTPASAYRRGLLVNLLNAKALLFFLSLFSVLLGPDIPFPERILAGLTMLAVQLAAFGTVARLCDQPRFRSAWPQWQHRLDLGISLVLLFLGCWIWISQIASLAG